MPMTAGGVARQHERPRAGALSGRNDERIALQDVEVHATLRDLLCEVSAVQVYRNDEARAIEAVYTFPLPLDAVLLELQVTLGERVLTGQVVEAPTAQARYEEAMAEGDGAVMLEMVEPGLYTMNVGNLLPGEVARITTRYALVHRWMGERLRLHFPTTIAPRYGAMPLQPHQQPEQSLTVENRFAFSLSVIGELRSAQFTCRSHPLVQRRDDASLILSLASARAVMDRDLVIEVAGQRAARSAILLGNDGDGSAAIASFQPFFGGLQPTTPCSLAIVVDCSGSMAGDSMQQARRAVRDILTQLQAHDRIGIIAFGSGSREMHDAMLPCTTATLERANAFCDTLEGDMGGTEIGAALARAHALLQRAESGTVFLITDGQVGAWEGVVAHARKTGHRHFTVGVGSAVTEVFVRRLAEETQGAAELVSPQEGMSDRIVRHFQRLRSARAQRVRVLWPDGAIEATPREFGAVFDGDTLVASARFAQRVGTGAETGAGAGTVVLEFETTDGERHRQELHLAEAVRANDDIGAAPMSTVARLAAAQRLGTLEASAARGVAVHYRLASPYTNWLVIAERAEGEKAGEMPLLRKVPQTLAAGWGGTGVAHYSPMPFPDMPPLAARARPRMMQSRFDADASMSRDLAESSDGWSFLKRFIPIQKPSQGGGSEREEAALTVAERLVAIIHADPSPLGGERALEILREVAGADVLRVLLELADRHAIPHEVVATALLAAVCERLRLRGIGEEGERAVAQLIAEALARRATLRGAKEVEREVVRLAGEVSARE